MTEPPNHQDALTVWMDGDCPVCQLSRSWCEVRDHDQRLSFSDFRKTLERDLPVESDALERSMWVRDDEGQLFEGFSAWRRIMLEIPRWRWLGRLSLLPPLSWIGPPVYRFIARNRHLLPVGKRRPGTVE